MRLIDADALKANINTAFWSEIEKIIDSAPNIEVPKWIPCSERLPEDIGPVLVTWKNNDPASYYQYIVGKHYIGTAHYHRGKWYWYSSVTEDLLAEYGKCETEEFDEAIEAVAWMPLPKPYEDTDRKDFQVIVNGNCTKCGKPLSGNRIFICEECEEQSKEKGSDHE